MSSKLKTIPLCQLQRSNANVRKTDRSADIEQLAASIEANGLLENLVVHHCGNGNTKPSRYEVVAGGRRLSALKLLAKRKKIARDHPVACLIRTGDAADAVEASLAENFARLSLHPADQFEAFADLHAKGMPADDIAARYGVTPAFVQQRLKLASVSPRLVEEYRKGAMTLEQLTAFTLADDHGAQEAVWFDSPYADLSAQAIRRLLTQSQVESSDKRALFVGAEAYEAAGGIVVRDLFDLDGEGYFADSQLLDRLVAEKLEAAAETIRAEGWQWVEVRTDWDFARFSRYGRAQSVESPLSKKEEKRLTALAKRYDELVAALEEEGSDGTESELDQVSAAMDLLQAKKESWPEEEKKRAGAVVSLGPDGGLKIVRGLVVPDTAGQTANGKDAPAKKRVRGNGYAEPVLLELSAERTTALQEVLAGQPEMAFAALLHVLVGRLFYPGPFGSCIGIVATAVALDRASEAVSKSKAAEAFKERHSSWSQRLPEKDGLWDWIGQMKAEERHDLLAHCVAMTVNAVRGPMGPCARLEAADELAAATGLDMKEWWHATRAFFDRLTKTEMLAAVSEGVSPLEAKRLEGLKKEQMAKKAEALLARNGWLPAPLRATALSEEMSSHQ